jgi:hypothetical protein
MTRFKVCLSTGDISFVHATHFVNEGRWTKFYRGDNVIAEFATVSVLKVEVVPALVEPPSTRGGRVR